MFRSFFKITCIIAFLGSSISTFSQVGLHFDGVNDCLVAANAGPTGTSNRTVECWIKTSSTLTSQQVLVNWGSMVNGTRFTFNTIGNGKVRIEIGGNGFNSNRTINDGNWHHVAVIYDHQAVLKASLFIDGALDTARNFTLGVNTSNSIPITIGKRIDDINYFEGVMDEIRIWDVARSVAQLRTGMFTTYCSPQANLVAYYKLEEGNPNGSNVPDTIAIDYSSSVNDAKLRGFSLVGGTLSNWTNGNTTIVDDLNNAVVQNGLQLSAVDTTADYYQWIECTNFTNLIGDTLPTLNVTASGNYAVIIQKGICVDTSACIPTIISSLDNYESGLEAFTVSPTLVETNFTIQISQPEYRSQFRLLNIKGQLIEERQSKGRAKEVFELNEMSGIYLLLMSNENGVSQVLKVVKK